MAEMYEVRRPLRLLGRERRVGETVDVTGLKAINLQGLVSSGVLREVKAGDASVLASEAALRAAQPTNNVPVLNVDGMTDEQIAAYTKAQQEQAQAFAQSDESENASDVQASADEGLLIAGGAPANDPQSGATLAPQDATSPAKVDGPAIDADGNPVTMPAAERESRALQGEAEVAEAHAAERDAAQDASQPRARGRKAQ